MTRVSGPGGAQIRGRQAGDLDRQIRPMSGGCVKVAIGEGDGTGAGQGQDPAVRDRSAEVARDHLVGAGHQRGDHGSRVLLARSQHGIPPLLDVDGASQGPPVAGADPVGDLVAAQSRRNGVIPGEDEGQGGVGAHGSTVHQLRPPEVVIHRPILTNRGLAQFRPVFAALIGPETGLRGANRPEGSKGGQPKRPEM